MNNGVNNCLSLHGVGDSESWQGGLPRSLGFEMVVEPADKPGGAGKSGGQSIVAEPTNRPLKVDPGNE